MASKKLKKNLLILISAIFTIALVIILCISPIIKYLVEKYDEKYTGREIQIDLVYANPFTGFVYFKDLKIYESKSDSIFISADGLSINFELTKILSGTCEISNLTLDHPVGTIIQNNTKFSIDDIIKKFSSDKKSENEEPVHFNILDIQISDGEFHYREEVIPINYFIKDVNIESSGKLWDIDTIATSFSFVPGIGIGKVKGNFIVNSANLDYRFNVLVNKFDLQIIEQYLDDLTNYGSFTANVDADIKAKGNFKDKEDINANGVLAINDFHYGKNPQEDYTSFKKLVLSIDELSPKEHKYLFDSVSLDYPYFKYELYDYLNNVETMFGVNGSNVKAVNEDPATFNLVIEIAEYVKVLAQNFFKSKYTINRLAVYNGNFKFNDYSQSEKFNVALDPFFIFADSINKNQERVEAILRSGIRPYGDFAIKISINPNDSSDFDLNYQFKKLSVAMFNPYIISYTSFPLDRGSIDMNGVWKVRNGYIQSDNHLLVIDPRIGKRVRNKDTKWIPVPLIMFFVRERGNVIDYSIPIIGDLNSPKFKLNDVILDVLKNIFVKPPTTPYSMEVRTIENEVEKSFKIKWELSNNLFQENEEEFVIKISEFLKDNPGVSISVSPNHFTEKEKEYILFYEAKKKYFLTANKKDKSSFSKDDSVFVAKMSSKDSMFIKHLNKHLTDTMLFTIQQKCRNFIGNSIVDKQYKQLLKQREDNFNHYFEKNGTINQIKIRKDKSVIPFNGFSFYEIKYQGELPASLVKAYERINELNNKAPRNKYKKQRIKNSKQEEE